MASEDHDHAPGFVPGLGFSQEDWDEVCDNPEITDEQWATARPFAETHPEWVEAWERDRAARGVPAGDTVALRLDPAVLAAWRASGPGWRDRMGEALRRAVGL